MSFHIHITDRDRTYLDGLPLSPQAKQNLNQFVEQVIANVPDEFRLDPENRSSPDTPYFRVQYLFLDAGGDGRVHTIDFHVQDDKVSFGVLLIVFIDHHCGSGK